jgi:hypothetical protein
LAAPVAGGHQTTVAEAAPAIARTSAGAPTSGEPAPAVVAAGQDASLPDGVTCRAPASWLAAAVAARLAAAGLAAARAAAGAARPAVAAVAAVAGSSAAASATGTAALRQASRELQLAVCLRGGFIIMIT